MKIKHVLLVSFVCILLTGCNKNCEHQYVQEITTAATCTDEGVQTFTCNLCVHTYTETIPATGHQYESLMIKEPTCAEEGIQKIVCVNCDFAESEAVAMIEHSYGEALKVKDATCTQEGETESTCSVCGFEKKENTDALGHKWQEGTCTKAKTCLQCDMTDGEALGHTTKHGICNRCQQLVINFNNTYWNLGIGQTIGSQYIFLAKPNGTLVLYCYGSETFESGTYYLSGKYLYISFGRINNVAFEINGSGLISIKQYEMMSGKDHYSITVADDNTKNLFQEAYEEHTKLENAEKTFLDITSPLVEVVKKIKGKTLEEAEAIYGKAKLLVYEPSLQEYRFENYSYTFEIYYHNEIELISMDVADMNLSTSQKKDLLAALEVLFPAGSDYNSSFTVNISDGTSIEIYFYGFNDGKISDTAEFYWK